MLDGSCLSWLAAFDNEKRLATSDRSEKRLSPSWLLDLAAGVARHLNPGICSGGLVYST